MREIENLECDASFISGPQGGSPVGVVKGCLNYLNVSVSLPWFAGASGYVFMLFVTEDVCESNVYFSTAGCHEALAMLGRNVGYVTDSVLSWPDDDRATIARQQHAAWDMVRAAIDGGYPAYGYAGQYRVFRGYGDVGYLVDGGGTDGSLPWDDPEATSVEVYALRPCEPADDRTAVRAALKVALAYPNMPSQESDSRGLAAYDAWIAGVKSGQPAGHCGMAGSSRHYARCRELAAQFLEEARTRVAGDLGPLFDEAKTGFREASTHLSAVARLFGGEPLLPYEQCRDLIQQRLADDGVQAKTVELLQAAKTAEAGALRAMAGLSLAL